MGGGDRDGVAEEAESATGEQVGREGDIGPRRDGVRGKVASNYLMDGA